jgi:glycosyltransferase involved in cell wall biosynthesis
MRIALFAETFLPKIDGITTTLCYLLEYVATQGHSCLVFAPEGAPAEYAGTPIVGLPSFTLPFYPELRLVAPTANVEQECAEFRPDLVMLANPALLGLVGLRHARACNLPVVASYHTDLPYYTEKYGFSMLREPAWAYLRWLHNQADLNLCPSRFTQRQLYVQGFERVKVWRRGVDHERFTPRHRSHAWRERLSDGHPEAPLLLYVGRLAPEKRVNWLRAALDALPQARLAIVGDGPSRAELEALFAGTPTLFTGYLRGKDLSHAYASADVFCFPSASETFGNVVLEAMASGLPVVAPNCGGQIDHIRHNENGLLVPADDRAALAKQVAWLVADRPWAQQMGQNALAYARTQTWEAILGRLFENLQSVLETDLGVRDRPSVALHRDPPNWAARLGWSDSIPRRERPVLRERRWSQWDSNPTSRGLTRWGAGSRGWLRGTFNQTLGGTLRDNADGTTPHSRHE